MGRMDELKIERIETGEPEYDGLVTRGVGFRRVVLEPADLDGTMRLFVTCAKEPYPPELIRGAMFNLMALVGSKERVQLRAFEGDGYITYNAFVGGSAEPVVRIVNAAVQIVRE